MRLGLSGFHGLNGCVGSDGGGDDGFGRGAGCIGKRKSRGCDKGGRKMDIAEVVMNAEEVPVVTGCVGQGGAGTKEVRAGRVRLRIRRARDGK